MFVVIQGVKREGFSGMWRGGRFWPSGEARRVEVVDAEPPMVEEDVFVDGKKSGTRPVLDTTKISKALLETLRKEGRVSILGDGEKGEGAAGVDARVVALQAENASLRERLAAAETVIAAAKNAAEPVEQAEPLEHEHRKGASKR